MDRLSIEARNFGPISTARIDLSPLTIFVGANNTGKSYMAQLIYAINRTFSFSTSNESLSDFGYSNLSDRFYTHLSQRELLHQFVKDSKAVHAFESLFPKNYYEYAIRGDRVFRAELLFDKLPYLLKDLINNQVDQFVENALSPLRNNIQDCFGTKPMNLVGKFGKEDMFSIEISSDRPKMDISINCERGNLLLKKKSVSLKGETIRLRIGRLALRPSSDTGTNVVEAVTYRLAEDAILSSIRAVTDVFHGQAYYLPAARSGILSGQKLIARAGLQALKYGGIKTISMRKMSGSMVDFIDAIYSIDKQMHADTYDLARDFERKILMGTINLKEYKPELPEIYFQEDQVGKVELHRSSSMISEMAAIILILKYLLEKGEILIIEEPESHLHPGAQLEFARLCIRLANRGVYVLLTTHSDYFLQKISNLIAMHNKSSDELGQKGYSVDEIIHPEQVTAYLFKRDFGQKGSYVTPLPVSEKGISSQSFDEVAEQLYDESLSA